MLVFQTDFTCNGSLVHAFGFAPSAWIDVLVRENKDRILIAFGVVLLLSSIALGFMGYGKPWVPDALIRLAGG